MIILNDGRNKLYQWDTNVYVSAEGYTQVHFSNILTDDSFPVDVVDGIARIPDELLQVASSLNVWGYIGTVEDGHTKTYTSFPVIAKSKPLDYVFTPTEQLTIQDILDKLDTLKGKDGKSITVESVTESTENGGSNVVTFSDGKSVTIRNGSGGSGGTVDSELSETSTNPVQNKVVTEEFARVHTSVGNIDVLLQTI